VPDKAKFVVRLLSIAEDDLDEIVAYVALDNLTAALKLAGRFESNVASLARFPELVDCYGPLDRHSPVVGPPLDE